MIFINGAGPENSSALFLFDVRKKTFTRENKRGDEMIPRIKEVKPLDNYMLSVVFDDGKSVIYDVKGDMDTIPQYEDLKRICGLFKQVRLDNSRTCVYWTDDIDLPSDIIYEYGVVRLNSITPKN